jgi:hypothetical protein
VLSIFSVISNEEIIFNFFQYYQLDDIEFRFGSTFLKGGFSKVDKGHKFVFVIYSDFTIIHHLGQAGVDRVTIHHQKGE